MFGGAGYLVSISGKNCDNSALAKETLEECNEGQRLEQIHF